MSSPKLDLAFAMDCTGSMGLYIDSAKVNIRKICEEIIASEQADVKLALVEYRDHPPQDNTFVTRVHDFTASISQMKSWLEACSASGGGDEPEAVADAMHDLLKLSWREDSAKLAVLVSDAPPHGIGAPSDSMPNGCPLGHDPMAIAHQLAQRDVTLYVVGVEPNVLRYRDFFMVLAHAAGGRYVPLANAQVLAKAVIASAQEEISLAAALAQVRLEVEQATVESSGAVADSGFGSAGMACFGSASHRPVDEEAVTRRVHEVLTSKGVATKQLVFGDADSAPPEANAKHIELSRHSNLASMRTDYDKCFGAPANSGAPLSFGIGSGMPSTGFGAPAALGFGGHCGGGGGAAFSPATFASHGCGGFAFGDAAPSGGRAPSGFSFSSATAFGSSTTSCSSAPPIAAPTFSRSTFGGGAASFGAFGSAAAFASPASPPASPVAPSGSSLFGAVGGDDVVMADGSSETGLNAARSSGGALFGAPAFASSATSAFGHSLTSPAASYSVKNSTISYGQTSRMVRKVLSQATELEGPSELRPP